MKCPTCVGAEEGRCCQCDDAIEDEDQLLRPDPYAIDVLGETDLHLQCMSCYLASGDEI